MRWALGAGLSLVTPGCVYNWQETQRVEAALIHKVETPLAGEFCSKLLGALKRGCAVRLLNTDSNITNCVLIVAPGDVEAIQHESAHCLGWDHPRR
jgi:hypothetical protein